MAFKNYKSLLGISTQIAELSRSRVLVRVILHVGSQIFPHISPRLIPKPSELEG